MSPKPTVDDGGGVNVKMIDQKVQRRAEAKRLDSMSSSYNSRKKGQTPAEEVRSSPASRALASNIPVPVGRNFRSNLPTRGLEPRGASEREDYAALRSFLSADPVRIDGSVHKQDTASGFDWESADGDANDKVSSKLLSVVRAGRRLASGGYVTSRSTATANKSTTSPQTPAKEARIQDRAGSESSSNPEPSSPVTSVSSRRLLSDSVRRQSVFKVFNNSVWSDNIDGLEDLAKIGSPRSVQGSPGAGSRNEAATASSQPWSSTQSPTVLSPNGKALPGRCGRNGVPPTPTKRARTRALTPNSPHLPRTPSLLSHEYSIERPHVISNVSPVQSSNCTGRAEKRVHEARGREDGSNQDLVSPSGKHFRSKATSEASTESSAKATPVIPLSRSMDRHGGLALRSPPASPISQPSTSSRSPSSPWVGLPKRSEDPGLNDGAKYVRKCNEDKDHRERASSRQRNEEEKLKKLEAAKDVINRQSQLGFELKKPIMEMSEDDFAVVGEVARAQSKESSPSNRIGLLSTFFKKMTGSKKQREHEAETIQAQLARHESLKLLRKLATDRAEHDRNTTYADDLPAGWCEAARHALQIAGPATTPPRQNAVVGLGIITNDVDPAGSDRGSLATSKARIDESLVRQLRPAKSYNDVSSRSDLYGAFSEAPQPAMPGRLQHLQLHTPRHEKHLQNTTGRTSSDPFAKSTNKQPFAVRNSGIPSKCNGFYQPVARDFAYEGANHYVALQTGSPPSALKSTDTRASPSQRNTQSLAQPEEDSPTEDAFDADAMPAPLSIRMLRVKSSPKHEQPADPNSFVPDRQGSFHARIHEVSKLQQHRLGSHPALREQVEVCGMNTSATDRGEAVTATNNISKHGRVDSGIGELLPSTVYSPGLPHRNAFAEAKLREAGKLPDVRVNSSQSWQQAYSAAGDERGRRAVRDLAAQALRHEVGLAPLALPTAGNATHPHHPFSWETVKVMCRDKHDIGSVPTTSPSGMNKDALGEAMLAPDFRALSETQMAETKMCESCGTRCCRFANLIITSNIKTNGDIMEEVVRKTAEARVTRLRASHPNGVEDYETFVKCSHCRAVVCPNCARECLDAICHLVICIGCRSRVEKCPVHNTV